MKKSVKLELPYKALSANDLYSGRKVRSFKYKNFRKQILWYLNNNYEKRVDLSGNLVMSLEVGYSSPLSDVTNSVKGIEDVVAEFFKFNDRQIVEVKLEKFLVDKGEEYMNIKIRQTTKNIERRLGK